MTMTYELWDTRSGNLLEEFESHAEALAAVRGYLRTNGPEMVRDLVLGAVPSTGLSGAADLPPILDGDALLQCVSDDAQTAAPLSGAAGAAKRKKK